MHTSVSLPTLPNYWPPRLHLRLLLVVANCFITVVMAILAALLPVVFPTLGLSLGPLWAVFLNLSLAYLVLAVVVFARCRKCGS
jgi:hypothetical protein